MQTKLSQIEKSEKKRKIILSSTIDEILSKGIHRTTILSVSQNASVSRGAILHHYPNRDSLMHAALEKVLSDEILFLRETTQKVKAGSIGIDELFDILWSHFSGPMFMISLEYLNSARTNKDIKNVLLPLAKNFNESLEKIWGEIVPDSRLRDQTLHSTLCMMRGMGLQSIWRNDKNFSEMLLSFWKNEIKRMLNIKTN